MTMQHYAGRVTNNISVLTGHAVLYFNTDVFRTMSMNFIYKS